MKKEQNEVEPKNPALRVGAVSGSLSRIDKLDGKIEVYNEIIEFLDCDHETFTKNGQRMIPVIKEQITRWLQKSYNAR